MLYCVSYSAEEAMMLAMPFTLLFSFFLIVSNTVLIIREGAGLPNILAIGVGCALLVGLGVNIFLDILLSVGDSREIQQRETITSLFRTVFAYCEYLLIGIIICGLIAAKRRHKPVYDHVIILGCQVGKDGTPLPLLEGRIKRALAYASERKAVTGKETVFVCSGGKGSDEPVSEALCMKNYLLEKGISEEYIILEDKSVSTQENMRFSFEKIGAEDAMIVFSTSSYHVLRSGIIAAKEGISADGVGAKTKWYFWPNAFMREFIGLVANKKKSIILSLLFLSVFYASCKYIQFI